MLAGDKSVAKASFYGKETHHKHQRLKESRKDKRRRSTVK